MRIPRLPHCLIPAAALAALAIVTGASPAQAATACDRVAAPSGSDAGAGSLASPFATAQKLVSSLAPGQVGCFRAGTYTFSEVRISTAGITLTNYGAEAALLKGSIKVVPAGAGTTIEGLSLNGGSGATTIGPRIYANDVALRGNDITNSHKGICVFIASFYDGPAPQRVLVERNRIHNCGKLPSTNYHHGIYLSEAHDTVIRDNWIYDNADRGIQQYRDVRGSVITGNVIAGNGDGINFSGTGGLVTRNSTVTGNIVVDSKIGYNAYSGGDGPNGTGNIFSNNCVHAIGGGTGIEPHARSFTAQNNLTAAPRFVNAAAKNFQLRGDSTCLGKYAGTMSQPTAPGPGTPPPPQPGTTPGRVGLDTGQNRVHRGDRVRVAGDVEVVEGASAAQAVIQRRARGGWRSVRRAAIRPNGDFGARVRASRKGVLKMRALVQGTGRSRVVRVKVRG